ncbi:V-type ATP synthase subunit I [Ructibacterium gallinarum]|uniref:V-type ATP synthase subunit I n=1 Tax=Ructibacterium gallinarum TaxID=2779355 RepID=A0A9D5M5Z9_9FIRM|nr:V-type ATP synthase subunit I [Ructibacterium gallinarum]MBE5040112.1 V-type ATP synthase subunit I [Ructibacterium gallinarum]
MAVVAMDKVTIYGTRQNRKKILEALQRRSVIEVTEESSEENFQKLDTAKARSLFDKAASAAEQALQILDQYASEKKGLFSSLEGRKQLSAEEYYTRAAEVDQSMNVAKEIIQAEKSKSELLAEIQRRENQIVSLLPWRNLDVPMTFEGTKKTAALIGLFPEQQSKENILALYQEHFQRDEGMEKEPYPIEVQVISQSQEQTCVFVLCRMEDKAVVEQILRTLGFARPAVFTSMVPNARIERHQKKIAAAKKQIQELEEGIRSYQTQREKLCFLYDYYTMRREKYEVLEKVRQGKRIFIITGFVPHMQSQKLEAELSAVYGAAVETEPASDEDNPPVLLKNNAFAAPVETVLETYSMPGRGEVDPTSVMAVFYYVLFGLMLSDAAYGLLMVIGCGLVLHRYRNMESGMKKTLTMFLYCGISTAFWGVMFGSYFGDAVSVIAQTFFHRDFSIPAVWFVPVNEPMRMLIFSMALGIVHIFGGLAMKLYMCLKHKDYTSAFFDVICWYLLVGGGVVYLLTVPMFLQMAGLSFSLPAVVGTAAAVCAGIGAAGIILFAGRSSKNPAKRIAKGLYELYGVTSYLSDILSYSRLLALGLATGVIAQVFNKMGSMFGGGILGAILFILVFLIGHTLNMAINLLGAYVHTNRLQFVEFFGKFYEGGGEKYTPFAVNTKYYQVKEEN